MSGRHAWMAPGRTRLTECRPKERRVPRLLQNTKTSIPFIPPYNQVLDPSSVSSPYGNLQASTVSMVDQVLPFSESSGTAAPTTPHHCCADSSRWGLLSKSHALPALKPRWIKSKTFRSCSRTLPVAQPPVHPMVRKDSLKRTELSLNPGLSFDRVGGEAWPESSRKPPDLAQLPISSPGGGKGDLPASLA